MTTVQLLLAIASIMGPACSQQTDTIPLTLSSTVINPEGADDGLCTSDMVRESVRQDINSAVQELVQTALRFIPRPGFTPVEQCGEGLWRRVAFLNMSDPTEQCPSAWRLYDQDNVRACGRPVTSSGSCPSTIYSVDNTQFSRVCGRIIGYQFATPDGFTGNSINSGYVDGVSVTHGSPRSHIWTFIATNNEQRCACTSGVSFVGSNYFCESGTEANLNVFFLPNDPLWDGQMCTRSCCEVNSPPWFSVELTSPTTDDIEVRICADSETSDEDTPVATIEIYIQ